MLHSLSDSIYMFVWIHRLMVECNAPPGSPGEVRLHLMDQPPPPPVQSAPAAVNVQLRIATGVFLLWCFDSLSGSQYPSFDLSKSFHLIVVEQAVAIFFFFRNRWNLHQLPPWGSPASPRPARPTSLCGSEPARPPRAWPGAACSLLPGLHSSSIHQLDAGVW